MGFGSAVCLWCSVCLFPLRHQPQIVFAFDSGSACECGNGERTWFQFVFFFTHHMMITHMYTDWHTHPRWCPVSSKDCAFMKYCHCTLSYCSPSHASVLIFKYVLECTYIQKHAYLAQNIPVLKYSLTELPVWLKILSLALLFLSFTILLSTVLFYPSS